MKSYIEEQEHLRILDHGYVRVVDYMGDDLSPLEAARMSTNNGTGVDEAKDDRLRDYLWSAKHSSPFEINEMVFELQLPIFVLRQLDRHRTIKISNPDIVVGLQVSDKKLEGEITIEDYDEHRVYTNRNEFSGRYSEMPDLFYIPDDKRIKGKDPKNKQGSKVLLSPDVREMAVSMITDVSSSARMAYETLLKHGVASEIARLVLPLNQYTKIRMKACLLHWLKHLDLRLRPDVQEETRAFAQVMARHIQAVWPKCWDLFEEYNLYGTTLSRTDRFILSLSVGSTTEGRIREVAIRHGYSKHKVDDLVNRLLGPQDSLTRLSDFISFDEGESS